MASAALTPGIIVRIVNRDTGEDVGGNLTATVAETPSYAHPDAAIVWVRLSPSFRPGMPYDLTSYPASWIEGR